MKKAEFIKLVAEELDMTQVEARRVSDGVFQVLEDALGSGTDVSVGNLGKFKIVESAARKGRNPQTGEEIDIPAKNRIRYTPSQLARDLVL